MVSRQQGTGPRTKSLRQRVVVVLDQIRPLAQADGGDIELVDVDSDGVVSVRLKGACIGCPSAAITLTLGIERNIIEHIPEVKRVVCV